jgi:hypothetical protein
MKETSMTTKSKLAAQLELTHPVEAPVVAHRKPTHRLYRVIGEGKSAIWTPIGAAWPNKDGLGFNLSCDAVPLTGRLVLRFITSRDDISGGQS